MQDMTMALDYRGQNLVLIVGCPRSGTTWLQRLLAMHPKVHTGQESFVFTRYVGPQLIAWHRELVQNVARGGVGMSCYLRTDEFLAILKGYLLRLLEPMVGNLQDDEVFLEKTPTHALVIPEIKGLLPDCRIVHMVRDPRDVVASWLASQHSWASRWPPLRAAAIAEMWVEHVSAVSDAAAWLPLHDFHEVYYEQLYSAPERTLREIVNALGLEWNEEAIRKAVETNTVAQIKNGGGTPIPLFGEVADRTGAHVVCEPDGFVRFGRPGEWRHDLSLREKIDIWRIARKAMQEKGYQW